MEFRRFGWVGRALTDPAEASFWSPPRNRLPQSTSRTLLELLNVWRTAIKLSWKTARGGKSCFFGCYGGQNNPKTPLFAVVFSVFDIFLSPTLHVILPNTQGGDLTNRFALTRSDL